MFFRVLMLIAGSMFVATVTSANAKVAPDYLHTNMFDQLPQLQLRHGSDRAICPLYGVGGWHWDDVYHLDVSHLYDWAHPAETRDAREKCAMPAPDPDIYENIG